MATWWSQTEGPPSAEMVAERIARDPHYRIWLAVHNNPDAVIDRYMKSYAVQIRPGSSLVIQKLQQLYDQGYEQAAMEIIDVPWVQGTDPMLDAGVAILRASYTEAVEAGDVEPVANPKDWSLSLGTDSLGIGQLGTALSNWFGGGFDAQTNVAQAQATAYAQAAQAQAQAKAYSSRMLMIGAGILAVALVIVVIVLTRRRK